MTSLRILHVNTERGWRGGERQLMLLACQQMREGHRPFIACQPGSPCANRLSASSLEVYPVPMRGEWDLKAMIILQGLIRALKIDLLHLHTSHAHTLGVGAAVLAPVPTVVHRRVDFPPARHPLSSLKYGARVHQYIAISNAVARVLEASAVAPDRISVVFSAIESPGPPDQEVGTLRRTLGLSSEAPVIGNIAQLVDHKGHSYLIQGMPEILSSYPGAKLLIVGSGPLRSKLEAQVAALKLDGRVLFTGFRDDATELIQLMDVFVMPSHLEGLNTSIMDALARCRPVVATTAGGIPEVVGEGGWLVPPRDPSALARAILEALGTPQEASRRAHIGQERIAESFSPERMSGGTHRAYQEALEVFRRVSRPEV